MSKFVDLSGKKFGKLIVIDRAETKNRRTYFNCVCDCGVKCLKRSENLKSGRVNSCGCIITDYVGDKRDDWKGKGKLSGTQISNIKRSAKKRTYEYLLTPEYLWKLFEKQNGKCALTGDELTLDKWNTVGNGSLDRIKNELGYIRGNVRWVTKDANLVKRTLTDEQLFEFCRKILKLKNELNR